MYKYQVLGESDDSGSPVTPERYSDLSPGWVYIIKEDSFNSLYKIGFISDRYHNANGFNECIRGVTSE